MTKERLEEIRAMLADGGEGFNQTTWADAVQDLLDRVDALQESYDETHCRRKTCSGGPINPHSGLCDNCWESPEEEE